MGKKILIYNWIQYAGDSGRGGGISVYLNNLIGKLSATDDVEITFLSSGDVYKKPIQEPFIEKQKIKTYKNVKAYRVVNSPIIAPSYLGFSNVADYYEDNKLLLLLCEFIKEKGPFDVFHINSLEGLSSSCLKVKESFPSMKLIFSIHNYHIFCPQVNLWNKERENCKDYCDGEKCINCIPCDITSDAYKRTAARRCFFESFGIAYNSNVYKILRGIRNILKSSGADSSGVVRNNTCESYAPSAEVFKKYRVTNVEYLNKYVDLCLAVSKRVCDIAVGFGVDRKKICVDYIGTKAADKQKDFCIADTEQKIFKIVYMGYQRRDKGFYFLLDALDRFAKMHETAAGSISVTLCAKSEENGIDISEQLEELRNKYFEIVLKDGYSRQEQAELLADKNLGIVPVLWEDNMPQVAIEMQSSGVPILCSDCGGASELPNSADFMFAAGDEVAFAKKLIAIYEDRDLLKNYWKHSMKPVSMDAHVKRLLEKIY